MLPMLTKRVLYMHVPASQTIHMHCLTQPSIYGDFSGVQYFFLPFLNHQPTKCVHICVSTARLQMLLHRFGMLLVPWPRVVGLI